MKKSRFKIYAGIIVTAVIALAVGFLTNFKGILTTNVGAANDYTITLNYSNGGSAFPSSYTASDQINTSSKTNKGNEIDITYNNVKRASNKYAVVASSGTLYNSTRLTGLETLTITFSGSLSLQTSSNTTFSGSSKSLTSGTSVDVPANEDFFKLTSSGETTIDSIVATYSCTPKVVVYEKVTSAPSNWSGTYLIACPENGWLMKSTGFTDSTSNYVVDTTKFSTDVDSVSGDYSDYEVTIESYSSGYTIALTNGDYIYRSATSNGMNIGSTQVAGTFSFESKNEINYISNNMYLRANDRFRFYKASSYTNSPAVTFYKKGYGDSSTPSGGDDPVTPTTETYEFTIQKSNSGLSTSGYSYDLSRSYTLGDGVTSFDVIIGAGAYNMSSYDEFRITAGSFVQSDCEVLVKSIWIDFYGGGYGYCYVSADGKDVAGSLSATSGSGTAYEYEINSSDWKIYTTSGYATVYAITFTCEISTGPIEVSGVSLNKTSTTIAQESQETLVATVTPTNATNKGVTWTSENPSIATVSNGTVTGVSAGTTTITVTTTDGGYTATCSVTVTAVYHVSSVSLNKNALALNTGGSETLIATISPSNATNKNITWASSNTSVATVSGGIVTAVAAGSATITVTTVDQSKTATCSVTVTDIPVSSISLNKNSTTIAQGSTETLSATVLPNDATNKSVTWSSSNTNIATVSNGTVTAVAKGSATITVRSVADNTKYATCTVTVTTIAVTSVTLNKSSTSIVRGSTETLTATVAPSNATNKTINWTSSNSNIATVSSAGIVTAVATGSATITATSADNNTKYATCTVTVTPKTVTGVSLDKASLSLGVGDDYTLIATVTPSDADDKSVSWTSSATSVATVNSSGKVTAVAAGTATITVTTTSGGHTATCTVTVTDSTEKTYQFTAKTWTAAEGNWSSGKDGYGYSAERGVQITSGFTGANATSPESFDGVTSVIITYCTNANSGAGSIAVTVGGTTFATTDTLSKNGGSTLRTLTYTGSASGYVSFTVTCTTSSVYVYSVKIVSSRISATDVSTPDSISISAGHSKNIPVTYTPMGANKDTAITWSKRSGSSKITVDSSGLVSVAENAVAGSDTAVIRATLDANTSKYSDCTIIVAEQETTYTIMIYMCGSDLESGDDGYGNYVEADGGFATANLDEITSIDFPDNINVIIETGGAKKWWDSYGINKDKVQRWHVANNTLVLDETVGNASSNNMADEATFEEFLDWGLSNYPADKTGLIMWDHGNGVEGCCSDEYSGEDWNMLLMSEMQTTFNNVLGNKKLEWIGYDCCLMALQDLASINADYFNYMISAEESEPGYGWDYDGWLQELVDDVDISTVNLGASICETFKTKCANYYNTLSGYKGYNDATLAVFDLSKMGAYVTAWESMISNMNINSTSAFNSMVSNCIGSINNSTGDSTVIQKFGVGYDDDTEKYDWTIGCCDAYAFLDKVKTYYSSAGASTVQTKYNDVVVYKAIGNIYTNKAYGMSMFVAYGVNTSGNKKSYTSKSEYQINKDTKFTNWHSINTEYGTWYS